MMIEEKIKIVADEKFPLDGILTLPDDLTKKVPAVVMVHGSGPNNRDEQIGKQALFKDLAESLAAAGIASVRYDKRTLIYGKEMVTDLALSVREETIEDAIAAANLLRADGRIASSKIFIAGHSMGGALAPRIDAEGGDFAGLILLAGTARKLEDVILEQNAAVIKNLPEDQKEVANAQLKPFVDLLHSIYQMTDEEAQTMTIAPMHVQAYYLKEWGKKPVEDYLRDFRKPILVLQGQSDFQVSVEADFEKFKTYLKNDEKSEFKLYPGLSHLFMQSHFTNINDFMKEYEVEEHLDAQVVKDISNFILKN